MNQAELQWVRAPLQDRSRRTLERILDAAEGLLVERGFESVSVAEIAEEAGSSVGAIYARFSDKNGLLHFLHERFCEEAMATSDEALSQERWRGSSTREIISALTAFLVRIYSERTGLLRAFLFHGLKDPVFRERDMRMAVHFISRLQALLLTRRDEIRHPHPALAVTLGMSLVMGVLQGYLVLSEDETPEFHLPLETLEQELTRAYSAYLGLADPGAAVGGEWTKNRRTG